MVWGKGTPPGQYRWVTLMSVIIRLLRCLFLDPTPDINYFTREAQKWAHTSHQRTAINILQPPPATKPTNFRGFWPGSHLTVYHGVYNKLLAKHFTELNTEENIKVFVRVSVLYIYFVC